MRHQMRHQMNGMRSGECAEWKMNQKNVFFVIFIYSD